MLGWIAVSGAVLASAGGALTVALYPPLPRDLGGARDLDGEAARVRIPVPGDGDLDGWLLAGSRPAVVALLHGYGRTHHRSWRYASFLRRLGLHALAFDFRSSRGRARRPTTLGYYARRDAEAALDWTLREPSLAGCRIGLLGESLGGSVGLELAARRPEVAAVVADGAFATSARALEDSCARWAHVPRRAAAILRAAGRACTGHDPGAVAPLDHAPRLSTRPVFFIHGLEDNRIGEDQVRALWSATGGKDPLWLVPRAGHNEAWARERATYERLVAAFFARHLLGEGDGIPAGPGR